jgi:hypothetical protein
MRLGGRSGFLWVSVILRHGEAQAKKTLAKLWPARLNKPHFSAIKQASLQICNQQFLQ